MSFTQDLQKVLRQNVREYGMYIALFVIMAIFTVATNGLFISPRNIANLINQTGYIAVLAVGMTLVIVIRHIDLSVGFLAGFLGAVAAIALVQWSLPVIAVIPIVLALGVVAGLITAFLVAYFGIPSFVATLAGVRSYKPNAERLRPADRMIAHTGFLIFARKVTLPEGETWRIVDSKRYKARKVEIGATDESDLGDLSDSANTAEAPEDQASDES